MAELEKVTGHLVDCLAASREENTWVFVRKDIVADAVLLLKAQDRELSKVRAYNSALLAYGIEQKGIVRCEDCVFHDAGENEIDAWDRCKLHCINTEPDHYCSWAVKKNG